MDETLQSVVAGIVRHALTGLAGVLVADGYIQSSQEQQFIGAGVFIVGIIWSWWQKSGQAKVKAELQAAQAKVSVLQATKK